jgi:hypothetical protein
MVVRGAAVMRVLHVVAVVAVVVLVVVPGVMAMSVLVAMGVRVFVFMLMFVGHALVVAVSVAVDARFVLREAAAVLTHGALLYLALIVCSLPIEASSFQLTIEYSHSIGNQEA